MRFPGIPWKNFQIMIFIIRKLIVSIERNFVLSLQQLIRQLELLKKKSHKINLRGTASQISGRKYRKHKIFLRTIFSYLFEYQIKSSVTIVPTLNATY